MKIVLKGKCFESEQIEVIQNQLNLYADASGDHNIIHLNEAEAKKAGLPGVIAHGMYVASLVGNTLESLIQKEWKTKSIKIFQIRFKKMTFLGEKIKVSGKWTTADGNIEFNMKCTNESGEVKIQANALIQ